MLKLVSERELINDDELKTIYLYPSLIHVSREPILIKTILGSCVSVCLWDKTKKYGGMNHFMLPGVNGTDVLSAKYGNVAIEELVTKMRKIGSYQENLVAKIFGGSDTFKHESGIGIKNIDTAYRLLKLMKIPVVASNTGGRKGRKLLFNTYSGEVLMKLI